MALSGCNPARGEPAGAGGEQPRRSPPDPPRPGPQAPPPLPPAAAPAMARRLPASAPQQAPHSPPTPAAAAYLLYGAGTGPLILELSLDCENPDLPPQPIHGLAFPFRGRLVDVPSDPSQDPTLTPPPSAFQHPRSC